MRKYLLIFAGVIILLVIIFFLQSFVRSNLGLFSKNATVKFNNETVRLEVADTPEKREVGLSEKRSLGDKNGMLFVFDTPGNYPFWMKEMDFPIDIIFLNDNRIVTIHENVPAPEENTQDLRLYPPTTPADKVIELNAGKAKEYGLKVGQTLEIIE